MEESAIIHIQNYCISVGKPYSDNLTSGMERYIRLYLWDTTYNQMLIKHIVVVLKVNCIHWNLIRTSPSEPYPQVLSHLQGAQNAIELT